MAVAAETLPADQEPIPIAERALTEADNLSRHRQADGSYPDHILQDELLNLRTAAQEAAMPFAVSVVEHEAVTDPETNKRTFMWLGKTAVEAARGGYAYHVAPEAIARVDVEVDEARHAEEDLKPGVLKVLISPRMSKADAAEEIARQEHLADDDAIRASWLMTDENGQVEKRVMQSLLVRDIPLQAWVAMLADGNNPFHKTINVENPESALSVMQVHRELQVPLGELPEGPVSVVEAVVPYITDETTRQKVQNQLELFRGDQEDMHRKAESIAKRWLSFEISLSQSLDSGFADFEIRRFIIGLQEYWGDEDLSVIRNHMLPDTEYLMTRELAIVLENAKQNTLWTAAGATTNNTYVLKQMDPQIAQRIRQNETLIQLGWENGYDTRAIEAENNRLIASQNVKVGGGCPGTNEAKFRKLVNEPGFEGQEPDQENQDTWRWKTGVCRVASCPTRPGKTEVGPCEVCRKCQARFDHGEDPTKDVVPTDKSSKKSKEQENEPAWMKTLPVLSLIRS